METIDQGQGSEAPTGQWPEGQVPPPPPPATEPEPVAGGEVPVGAPPARKRKGGPWGWLLAILLLACVSAGGWVWYQEREAERVRIQEAARQEAARKEAERLEKARGAVRVHTTPGGATVYCDGRKMGVAPLTVGDLRLGKHEFRTELADHEGATATVEVRENATTDSGAIVLKRSVGNLSITTVPVGAEFVLVPRSPGGGGGPMPRVPEAGAMPGLALRPPGEEARNGFGLQAPAVPVMPLAGGIGPADAPPAAAGVAGGSDARRGVTPAVINDLPTGTYDVDLRLASWTRRCEVAVLRNQTASVNSEFKHGAVVVTSEPSGAWVKREGVTLGQTPLRLGDIEAGPVSYTVEIDGHEAATVEGTVEAVKETDLEAKLRPFGEVVVVSVPAGALVKVNGQEMGRAPLAVRGTEGAIQVKVSLDGYFETDLPLQIKGGQRLEQRVMLEQLSGHAMGILVPGKPGFVRSPYRPDAGMVEVRDFATGRPFLRGTEVKCPFTGRVFLVP